MFTDWPTREIARRVRSEQNDLSLAFTRVVIYKTNKKIRVNLVLKKKKILRKYPFTRFLSFVSFTAQKLITKSSFPCLPRVSTFTQIKSGVFFKKTNLLSFLPTFTTFRNQSIWSVFFFTLSAILTTIPSWQSTHVWVVSIKYLQTLFTFPTITNPFIFPPFSYIRIHQK